MFRAVVIGGAYWGVGHLGLSSSGELRRWGKVGGVVSCVPQSQVGCKGAVSELWTAEVGSVHRSGGCRTDRAPPSACLGPLDQSWLSSGFGSEGSTWGRSFGPCLICSRLSSSSEFVGLSQCVWIACWGWGCSPEVAGGCYMG